MPAVASQYLSRMAPVITERFEPEGTLLELFLKKNSDKAGKAPENAECFFLLSGAIVS